MFDKMINAKWSIKEKSLYNNSITQSISSIPRVHSSPILLVKERM
jgi:hypothetical protein